MENLNHSPLGKASAYLSQYSPELLFAFPRTTKRKELGIPETLPFHGNDCWNAYEISWLNLKGKPEVAIGEIFIPSSSPDLIESKSMKLYLNSFTQSKFASIAEVKKIIQKDLSEAAHAICNVNLIPLTSPAIFGSMPGECIDDLDIETHVYQPHPDFLTTSDEICEETLHSHLVKSNCLVTGQPDWGSVVIRYKGPKINREGLLKYIISYRDHNEFAEQWVEGVFMDIMRHCKPEKLTVYARYTRRGGLDINPFRSNFENDYPNLRLFQQ